MNIDMRHKQYLLIIIYLKNQEGGLRAGIN